jgi:hypothetical protein
MAQHQHRVQPLIAQLVWDLFSEEQLLPADPCKAIIAAIMVAAATIRAATIVALVAVMRIPYF